MSENDDKINNNNLNINSFEFIDNFDNPISSVVNAETKLDDSDDKNNAMDHNENEPFESQINFDDHHTENNNNNKEFDIKIHNQNIPNNEYFLSSNNTNNEENNNDNIHNSNNYAKNNYINSNFDYNYNNDEPMISNNYLSLNEKNNNTNYISNNNINNSNNENGEDEEEINKNTNNSNNLIISNIKNLNFYKHSIYYYISNQKGYYLDLVKGKKTTSYTRVLREYCIKKIKLSENEDNNEENETLKLSKSNNSDFNNNPNNNNIEDSTIESEQIQCLRRYKNFEQLDKYLREKYPHFIIPFLSEKSAWTLVMDDEEFLERRRKQLKFYLNYLFNHNILSKEIEKFLNDPFDEAYFSEYKKDFLYYPEFEKTRGIIMKNINRIIDSFYSNKDKNDISKEMENTYKFYSDILNSIKVIYENFGKIQKNIIKKNKNNEELLRIFSNDININKEDDDNDKDNYNNKNDDDKIEAMLKELNIIKENNKERFIKYYDTLDELYLLLNGIDSLFERYNHFLKKAKNIRDFNYDKNMKDIDEKKIIEEKEKVLKDKTKFEKNIKKEIQDFSECYKYTIFHSMDKLALIIKNFNNDKYKCLNDYKKYFYSEENNSNTNSYCNEENKNNNNFNSIDDS